MGTALFPLGRVVATPGALEEVLASTRTDTLTLLRRHASGDWGEIPPEDARENELSVSRASGSSRPTPWALPECG